MSLFFVAIFNYQKILRFYTGDKVRQERTRSSAPSRCRRKWRQRMRNHRTGTEFPQCRWRIKDRILQDSGPLRYSIYRKIVKSPTTARRS